MNASGVNGADRCRMKQRSANLGKLVKLELTKFLMDNHHVWIVRMGTTIYFQARLPVRHVQKDSFVIYLTKVQKFVQKVISV